MKRGQPVLGGEPRRRVKLSPGLVVRPFQRMRIGAPIGCEGSLGEGFARGEGLDRLGAAGKSQQSGGSEPGVSGSGRGFGADENPASQNLAGAL